MGFKVLYRDSWVGCDSLDEVELLVERQRAIWNKPIELTLNLPPRSEPDDDDTLLATEMPAS